MAIRFVRSGYLVALVVLLQIPQAGASQEDDDKFAMWAKGIVGYGSIKGGEHTGFVYGGSLNLQYDFMFFSLRASEVVGVEFFSTPDPSLTELSPMIGAGYSNDWLAVAALVGFGAIWETSQGKLIDSDDGGWFSTSYYEEITRFESGFPFELQISFRITDWLALGADLIGNFNSLSNTLGFVFSLQLGTW